MNKSTVSVSSIILQNTFTVFNVVIAVITGGLFVLYWYTRDTRLLLDSVGVVGVALCNTAIAIFQEYRAFKALEKATLATAPFAMVFRQGAYVCVPAATVLVGDVVKVERGDMIPADGTVVESNELEVNEAMLTGEAESVHRDLQSIVFSGTYVVAGSGVIRVDSIGQDSAAGRIQHLSTKFTVESSPLQRNVTRVFEWSFVLALILATADALANGVFTSSNIDDIRRVTTLLLGLIPEGLMFFTTITLTLGLLRMAKKGVVIQKITSLEILAGSTVVCMDKTGTLTQNKLECIAIIPLAQFTEKECIELVAQYAHTSEDSGQVVEALRRLSPQHQQWNVQQRVAFSSSRKFSRISLQDVSYTLGAAEVVFNMDGFAHYYEQAKRVLLSSSYESRRTMVFVQETLTGRLPIAWVIFEDAPRQEAKQTLEYFESRNVRWMILTGDAHEPVSVLLQSVGYPVDAHQVLSGAQIEKLSQDELRKRLPQTRVISRLSPEQKLRVILTLKETDIVAMIGDGVNDLPAIREANVGIAMNESAGITKHIADVVLADSAFSVLPQMVTEGRVALRTVLNVAKLFVGKNFMLILMSAMSLFFNLPYPLTPRKSALISVIGVGIPSMLLAATASITTTSKSFLRELFVFVALSGITSTMSAHVVAVFILNPDTQASGMLFAIIGSVIGSFLCVDALPAPLRKKAIWICVAVVAILEICSIVPFNFLPLDILRGFYEVPVISTSQASIATICGGLALIFTMCVHKVFRMVTLR